MSAIQMLKSQVNKTATPVVDLSIRHLLAKALTDSGKFEAVNSKMDSRRGSLSVKVRGVRSVRDSGTLTTIAAKAGLTIQARLTSSDFSESTFKIEQLVITSDLKAAPTKPQVPVDNLLAAGLAKAAPVYNGSISINISGVSLGYISQEAADKIKAIVKDDQTPKSQQIKLVNLSTNSPENVMAPTVVVNAINGKVPSFTHGEWSVKATSGIVIVRHARSQGHWVSL